MSRSSGFCETGVNDSLMFMGRRAGVDYTPSVKLAVFGVPSAAGAGGSGVERAAFVLREAGLLGALRAAGARVVNLSDLSMFPFREDAGHPRARNTEVVACALRATADEMTRALAEGFTIVIGGDCTLTAGAAAGARKAMGRPVGLVYVDAHADLNTPDTTPSGLLNGMALALAMGRGPAGLVPDGAAVDPEHVALLGFRHLDPGERPALGDLALALPAAAMRQLGMRVAAALALEAVDNDEGPVLVHLDVDAIDYAEMPVKDSGDGGLSVAEVSDLVTALAASPRVIGMHLAEFQPERDADGTHARKVVDLLARAVARRVKLPA
jgi:arginase